jgi:structure-specific endonuclease subunit SLX1
MYVYILRSLDENHSNKTYVGKTNNPSKRIRQHNGLIVGGAKATRAYRPHTFFCLITGFQDANEALRFEYMLKHFKKKKKRGCEGRIIMLNDVIHSEKLLTKLENPKLKIHLEKKYHYLITDLPEFVKLKKHYKDFF